MSPRRLLTIAAVALLLAGCGQKGPLFRPGDKTPPPATSLSARP